MKLILTLFIALLGLAASGQSIFSSEQITAMMLAKKELRLQNAVIEGDIDLSSVGSTDTTALYEYNKKKYIVITTWINAPIACVNCVFKGKFNLHHEEKNIKGEIVEYRTEFKSDVVFKGCVFEGDVNFELANFDKSFSLAYSNFKKSFALPRIGLNQPLLLEGTVLDQPATYRNTQGDKLEKLNIAELKRRLGSQGGEH
jgi:hypothetical protein